MTRLERLRNYLRPWRCYLLASGETRSFLSEAGTSPFSSLLGRLAGEQLVISRARCSFQSPGAMSGLSGNRLARALYLEAEASSPYEDTGVFIDMRGGRPGIWTWDAQAVQRDSSVCKRHCLPETVLHSVGEGFALRRCIDGYEGQFWQNGALLLSRWWAAQPDDEQWRLFALSAESLGTLPEPLPRLENAHCPGAKAPPNRIAWRDRLAFLRQSEIIAMIALLLLPLGLYAGIRSFSLARLEADLEWRYREVAQTGMDNRRNMASLRSAIAEINMLDSFFGFSPLPSITEAIEEITAIEGMQIDRIRVDKGDFIVELRSEQNFSQPDLVGALEARPYIADVRVEEQSSGKRWSIYFIADRALATDGGG